MYRFLCFFNSAYREQVLAEEGEKEKAIEEDFKTKKKKTEKRKSEDVLARIVEGKVRKRLHELCLLQQNHMVEGKDSPVVGKHIENMSKLVNHRLRIIDMILWSVDA